MWYVFSFWYCFNKSFSFDLFNGTSSVYNHLPLVGQWPVRNGFGLFNRIIIIPSVPFHNFSVMGRNRPKLIFASTLKDSSVAISQKIRPLHPNSVSLYWFCGFSIYQY